MNKSLLALAMLTVSGTAMAQSPQWNKIEVSYLDATVDVGANADLKELYPWPA